MGLSASCSPMADQRRLPRGGQTLGQSSAVLRQQNCQVSTRGRNTPPLFLGKNRHRDRGFARSRKKFNRNIKISHIALNLLNWGLDKILLLC